MQKAKVNRGSPSSHNSNRTCSIDKFVRATGDAFRRPATINLTSLSLSSLSLSLNRFFETRSFVRSHARTHARHCCVAHAQAIDDFHFLRFIGLLKVTFAQAVTLD